VREDDFLEEPNHHSGVIGGANNGIHPLRDIVNGDQDVLVAPGRWEGSHEIYPPCIKDFNFKYIV